MDSNPWLGRRRPVAADALRILTVVHQLGRPTPAAGFASRFDGEVHLPRLDHLVRHPVDLAFALMLAGPRSAGSRQALARDVRSLLPGVPVGPHRPAARIHGFDPGTWERRDDVWAYLGCRGLLRVRPGNPPPDLAYLLTDGGAAHLESLYLTDRTLRPVLERCRILGKHLPRRGPTRAARVDLPSLARQLDDYRHREQLAADEDLLGRLFRTTFGEPL